MITRRKVTIGTVVSKYKLCYSTDKKKLAVLKAIGIYESKKS